MTFVMVKSGEKALLIMGMDGYTLEEETVASKKYPPLKESWYD